MNAGNLIWRGSHIAWFVMDWRSFRFHRLVVVHHPHGPAFAETHLRFRIAGWLFRKTWGGVGTQIVGGRV
jgi:hypothetical protein